MKLCISVSLVSFFDIIENLHLLGLFIIIIEKMDEKRKLFDDDLEFISSNPIISSTYYLK